MTMVAIATAHQNNEKNTVMFGIKRIRDSAQDLAIQRRIVNLVLEVAVYRVKVRRQKRLPEKVLAAVIDSNKLARHRAMQIIQVLETAAAALLAAQVVANNRIDNYGTITTINKS